MNNKKIKNYQAQVEALKKEIMMIGEMRPGSLTRQTYKRGSYTRRYWQISYTQKQRSKTEYVRESCVKALQQEIAEYKKFKKLVAEWVRLAVKISKEKAKIQNNQNSA